jgi:hypothetical protein
MVVSVGWAAVVVVVGAITVPGVVVVVVDGFMVVFVGVVVGGDMVDGLCSWLRGWSVVELVRWWCWRAEIRLSNCGDTIVRVGSDGPMKCRRREHLLKNFGMSL